jgi:hypothetical protein
MAINPISAAAAAPPAMVTEVAPLEPMVDEDDDPVEVAWATLYPKLVVVYGELPKEEVVV